MIEVVEHLIMINDKNNDPGSGHGTHGCGRGHGATCVVVGCGVKADHGRHWRTLDNDTSSISSDLSKHGSSHATICFGHERELVVQ